MDLFSTHVQIDGFERLDFDKKKVKAAMRKIGALIRGDARKKVALSAIKRSKGKERYTGSQPGQYPRKKSGTLRKSISYKVSRPGFMVKVQPDARAFKADNFYPAFLWYGVTGNARRKDRKAQVKNGKWRVAPRANYMADALQERDAEVRRVLGDALYDAIKVWP